MKKFARQARVLLLSAFVFCAAQLLRLNKSKRASRTRTAPRTLLIGAYGNGNFGDDIIGQAIALGVKSYGSVLIAARLEDVSRLNENVGRTVVVGGGLRSLSKILKLSRETDIAILGGGGLLEGRRTDVNVHRLILEYLGKLAVCGLRGQPIAIHGIGVSPNLYSSQVVNTAVRSMLRAVDVVAVRDPASYETVRDCGAKPTLIRDPAIVLFESWAPTIKKVKSSVGVVLLDHHRWPTFKKADAQAELNRQNELTELASQLISQARQGKHISIFNFHWSDVAMSRDLRDLFLTQGGDVTKLEVVPYHQTSSEVPFKLLMACNEVLTMRFHPALAALTSGAKVDVIGSLQKLEQLRSSTETEGKTWQYPSEYADPLAQLSSIFGRRDSSSVLRPEDITS
ncbi:Polysaccharide pyruvyl transferase family protein WcaK [Pseudarthrobacter enclensis]|uniref:polysaccharide pyruvyl transferase family protein n=1 Tax=Pseudarthrobacter enclensis TaxID=993070 RepID=UPI000815B019|nr:polysaccharide pyruvyl transferase family protein [Pseudarthrobacter enclensis]SCB75422.1 Polysaccharide pyruvyl transferase family protein WcaK [Pseudarthrobacter enclensis]